MTAPRRWSFGIRTMMVMVAVFGCWLGWAGGIVKQRRALLAKNFASDGLMFFTAEEIRAGRVEEIGLAYVPIGGGLSRRKWITPFVSHGLFLFGEKDYGMAIVSIHSRQYGTTAGVRSIIDAFPEASVGLLSSEGLEFFSGPLETADLPGSLQSED